MLASFDEAEDAVQETFLRAWRSRDSFDGGTMFRAWLYRIATNVCLDMIRSRSRRLTTMRTFAEVPWLQPYPDQMLDEVAPSDDEPDAVVVERETIELAFLAAMQVLPPRQRAALIARDVLGWPASETATLLETSVAATNSALQRARATMSEHLPAKRSEWSAGTPSDEERDLLARFIDAHERYDAALPSRSPPRTCGSRCRRTRTCSRASMSSARSSTGVARRGVATARHVGQPDADRRELPPKPGDTEFRAFKFDVLRIERREDRGDHDVRPGAVRGVRPADADPRGPAGRRLVRLVVHPLHRLGGVLGRVDGLLEVVVEVAPLDDLDRWQVVAEELRDGGPR